jgi:tetratricopeptide (TPR) repeat protein
MYVGEGDLRRAWELEAEARALADRFGDAFISLWLTMKRGQELYYRGRWDEALAVIDEVLQSDRWYAAMLARLTRAPILLARDRVRDALVDTGIALDAGRETRDSQLYYPALATRARALTFAGREEEAAEVAQELLDRLRGDEMFMGMYWLDLALVLQRLGRADELLPQAAQVSHPTRWVEAAVQIARGDFVAAAETCTAIGAAPEEAAARMYAAKQLREAGDAGRADAQLALATAFFERVGATAMLRRVAELNPALTG